MHCWPVEKYGVVHKVRFGSVFVADDKIWSPEIALNLLHTELSISNIIYFPLYLDRNKY